MPPRQHQSVTYWGPFPLPGNKNGHLGPADISFILQRTGWKVTTRFRGKNKKGKGWGCRMMSGRMQAAGTEGNRHRSQMLAQQILLEQQQTGNFPIAGAARVPSRAHSPPRPSRHQEYNPNNHLPSQTGAGTHRQWKANCRPLTMGWDSDGIPYTPDQAITLAKVHEKLKEAGHNIPKALVYCSKTGRSITSTLRLAPVAITRFLKRCGRTMVLTTS